MSIEILFVGTGDAFGSGGRRNSAILVRSAGRTLLLDCGPTTAVGLKTLGVDPREIDAIAISHFHGDHVAGVPFLLLDYLYQNPRSEPLEILGPAGTRERVERLAADFEYGVDPDGAFPLRYRSFEIGRTLEVGDFLVTPTSAHHAPQTRPHMLRVETDRRALFYSGDTGWHEELPDKVGDVDLFVCECVYMQAGAYPLHMATEELVRTRSRFRCRDLRLTHLGREVLDDLDRVPFDTADDGLRITL